MVHTLKNSHPNYSEQNILYVDIYYLLHIYVLSYMYHIHAISNYHVLLSTRLSATHVYHIMSFNILI